MYLSAHRVQAPPRDGNPGPQGINAFYYNHGPHVLPAGLRPESNPGVFVDSSIEVPPPGNRVRSYLDVMARDGTPLAQLAAAIAAPPRTASLPVDWTVGGIWCRFGAELELAPHWRRELQRLFARVAVLYSEQQPV